MNVNKRCLMMIVIAIFIGSFSFAYAEGEDPTAITVLLNDNELSFDVEPTIIDGSVMVPMRQIFEYLGAQVDWKPQTKNVVGYRRYKNSSNIFIKLQIGSNYAYNNGRKIKLITPPVILDGRTLVPVRFISESFGLKVDWDPNHKRVLLTHDGNLSEGKKTIDYTEYKPRFFDSGVKIMIPDYWNKLGDENTFGYKDEFEDIEMDVFDVDMDTPLPLEYIMEEYKFILDNEYKDAVEIVKSGIDNINNINVAHIDTIVTINGESTNQTHFFFIANQSIYRATFKYTEKEDPYYINIIKNIVSTIEISSQTFNTSDEHYVEYDGFFNNDIRLDTNIHANLLIENKLRFRGSFSEESNITELIATVSKGTRSRDFVIPISDNKFEGSIYSPYGLGKHNVTIKAMVNDGYEKIMQFSIVNMSVVDITNTMPSKYVNTDDEDTITTAQLLTRDISQERDRAYSIFAFVANNINIEPIQNETLRSSDRVLEDKSGSSREITYLFTAMTRSINIPCRIFSGVKNGKTHYWNQVLVNGSWVLVDVTSASGKITEDGYFKEVDLSYFDKGKLEYIETYDDIVELDE